MCFSPQQRTIFQHLNFKKCSRTVSFLTFSLLNVLFATAAYNFSTSQLQKVLGAPHVLYIFTSKCAFRHSGVQFLMSLLTTYLRTRRFNRPTFRLTRHTNPRENTAFRDFSNIWRGCIFFLLTFALLHLLPSDLTACLMCFSTLHIVGSLLFKLPSTIEYLHINQSNPFFLDLGHLWYGVEGIFWRHSEWRDGKNNSGTLRQGQFDSSCHPFVVIEDPIFPWCIKLIKRLVVENKLRDSKVETSYRYFTLIDIYVVLRFHVRKRPIQ